ncbi:MAG: hypothetical protein II932_05435 [Treponema sp.]|nr:hypothetical protein [Treponema sp.]
MACFLVPVTEAIITTAAAKLLERRERQGAAGGADAAAGTGAAGVTVSREPFSQKLRRLNALLWGGSALLAFEHLWHGEIQPFFPFLTAAADPADRAEMLHEMATVGVSMSLLVTAAWALASFIADRIAQRDAGSRRVGSIFRSSMQGAAL